MKKILEYLRLVLFTGGVLLGVQVPGFVDQYGKRLDSHMLESQISLSEFQRDANKYFSGDITKLIRHYQKVKDPIVNDGGKSIASLYQRSQHLKQALAQFKASIYSPYIQALVQPLHDIRDETWKNYDFAIILNVVGIVWGLSTGLMLTVLVDLLMATLGLIFRRPKRSWHRQKSSE